MPKDADAAERERAMRLVDSAPPEIRALIHEYDLHDLTEVASLLGSASDIPALKRALERNRALQQKQLEAEITQTAA